MRDNPGSAERARPSAFVRAFLPAVAVLGEWVWGAAVAHSIDEALRAAANNPVVAAEAAAAQAATAAIDIERAAGRPMAQLHLGIGPDLRLNEADPRDMAGVLTEVTVPIYQGGAVSSAVRARALEASAAEARVTSVRQNQLLATAVAYYDWLAAISEVEARRTALSRVEEELRAFGGQMEVGATILTDLELGRARSAATQGRLQVAQGEVERLVAELERLTGLKDWSRGDWGELPLPTPATANAPPSHPDLVRAARAADAAEARITGARAGLRLKVEASLLTGYVGVARLQARFEPAVRTSVRVEQTLFDGGATLARVRQAQAQAEQRGAEIEEVRRELDRRTRTLEARMMADQAAIEAAEVGRRATAESLHRLRAEWRVGSRTFLEFLNAQDELADADLRLIRARRDLFQNAYRLLEARGSLAGVIDPAPGKVSR